MTRVVSYIPLALAAVLDMGAENLCTDGSVVPVSEGHAEALALACEDAQALQDSREGAEAMAVRAAFYWQLCAGWDGRS